MTSLPSTDGLEAAIKSLPTEYQATVGMVVTIYTTELSAAVTKIWTDLFPNTFLTGFDFALGIVGFVLWTLAVIRVRTKRTVLMWLAALFTIAFNIVVSCLALNHFLPNYSIYICLFLFMQAFINIVLHSSQVARSLILIPNSRTRVIIEYSTYSVLVIYAFIIFGLLIRDCRHYFQHYNGDVTTYQAAEVVNNNFIIANVFFPAVGIVSHMVFLYQTYRVAYGGDGNSTSYVRIRTLFNSTALFAFISVSLYAIDIATVIAYLTSSWSGPTNGCCISLIVIAEFLMDYSVFLKDFLVLSNSSNGTKRSYYNTNRDEKSRRDLNSANAVATSTQGGSPV